MNIQGIRIPPRGRRGFRDRRRAGAQLLELMIALTILTVGAMGFLYATQANFKASRDISTHDLVAAAFTNAMETLTDANFTSVYGTYQDVYLDPPPSSFATSGPRVGELLDAAGNPARVRVHFDIDEKSLPPEYGPVIDLDGDGLLKSANVSTTYQILPTRLTLTFQTAHGLETSQVYVLLGTPVR